MNTSNAEHGTPGVIAHDADPGHAAERAYRVIRRQILTGERAAGEWLREGDLATVLGVSRTPVREAFRRLVAEGLASHERNRGVRVQNWDVGDLDEIFSLRSVLEPWGCSLTAARGTADIEVLEQLAQRMDRAAAPPTPDLEEVTALNNEFHRTILEASGNSRLVLTLSSLVDVPLVSRTFSLYTPDTLRRSLAHHHEIVRAFEAGDPTWAESVMRSHVRSAWAAVRSFETHGE